MKTVDVLVRQERGALKEKEERLAAFKREAEAS